MSDSEDRVRTDVAIVTSTTCTVPFGTMRMVDFLPEDDALLAAQLAERGITSARPAWDDPSVDWSSYKLCVLRSVWNYAEYVADFSRWLEATSNLTNVLNSPSVLRWNLDKHYLDALAAAGIAIVPSAWIDGGSTGDVLGKLMDERGWGTIILKPTIGIAGASVTKLSRDEVAEGARVLAADPDIRFMVQPFLPSVETSGELSLVFIDGRYAYAVDKHPPPGEYSVHSWTVQNRRLTYHLDARPGHADPSVIAAAEAALHVMGDGHVYSRVDFLRGDDGAYLVSEIEAIAPKLYFTVHPSGAALLADGIQRHLRTGA